MVSEIFYDAEFSENKRGKRVLSVHGYSYVVNRKNKTSTNWHCYVRNRYKCNARAVTKVIDGFERARITNPLHTHLEFME